MLTKYFPYFLGVLLMVLTSCSALKFVPPGQKLYTGAKVKLGSNEDKKYARKAKNEAEDIVRPIPNSSFLGIRSSLWWYYKTEKYEKGFYHWLHKKLGDEPVYVSMANPEMVSKAIETRLFNMGHFNAYCAYKWIDDSLSASIEYTITVDQPYTIKMVEFPISSDTLSRVIRSLQAGTLLKEGQQYSLDVLKEERSRIDMALKDRGFYYFNQEYLLYKAIPAKGSHDMYISMEVKRETPLVARQIYNVELVNLYADYSFGTTTAAGMRVIDSVQFYMNRDYIRPAPVLESVFLKSGKTYSRKDHNLTLNRLSNLGVYKFVAVNIEKTDSNPASTKLNANILLTPLPKKSLSPEIQLVSKSNNFFGPNLSVSHRNRNVFRGAELLVVNFRTAFETQFNGPYAGQYTYEINPNIELYIPRFILPFKVPTNSLFVPRTKFTLDFSYISRVRYYNINSIKYTFGYKWKQNLAIDHDLSLLSVNYFDISNQSSEFLALLNENPTLALRYEKQFILGITYSFYYNQQVYAKIRNPFYVNMNMDVAGNILSGISTIRGEKPNADNPVEVFGVKYSQYIMADLDLRRFHKLGRNNKTNIATRLFGGWGYPYGNASTMPYIKQYFSGGAYSLRGFPVYSVGPGTYRPPDSLQSLYFVQQGGEIKLEGNIEYRYTLVGIVKGAFFADAGNTWLNHPNSDIPGGAFKMDAFVKELAVDIGTGLRLDIDFFVLRLDLGIPIRKPWYPQGERWVFDEFNFGNKTWRRNNLILNLAFGYPF
jgi:outer membrane protein insertion porin family